MQEQGKKMKLIDEEMYFIIEEKNNQIDLSGKGVDLVTNANKLQARLSKQGVASDVFQDPWSRLQGGPPVFQG